MSNATPTGLITWLYPNQLPDVEAFYAQTLGLEVWKRQQGTVIFRITEGSYLGICDIPGRPRGTAGMVVTVLCNDIHALHQQLVENGVAFEHGPEPREGGSLLVAKLEDPAGYKIHIQQFV